MISHPIALQSKANPQQLEAILAIDGPVLIIAGPGSGKTFTLVERIVYLITHKGVTPESLLVVTFTDKAARELTTRISNRLAEVGTLYKTTSITMLNRHRPTLSNISRPKLISRGIPDGTPANAQKEKPLENQGVFRKAWRRGRDSNPCARFP